MGAYQQLDGVVHFAVDPEDGANETIADIQLAPRNGQGLVEFEVGLPGFGPHGSEQVESAAVLGYLEPGEVFGGEGYE